MVIRGVKCWVSIAILHTPCFIHVMGRYKSGMVHDYKLQYEIGGKETFPFKNLIQMGQWAIKIWNWDLVIRGMRCWISISILHTSMFYTRDCVSIDREPYMIINSNRKLVEVWELMQHATKWFCKSFPLFQLASRQFQPVFLKEDIGHMVFYNSFVSG